jgi:hypothetical protein
MNEPYELPDAALEAFFAGEDGVVDPRLAEFIADVRIAYTSIPPAPEAELLALMSTTQPVPSPPRSLARFCSAMLVKIGAATAAVIAATGGLAVANALPAPLQDAASNLGIGAPAHHASRYLTAEVVDESTTTTTSSTLAPPPETRPRVRNQRGAVSAIGDNKGSACGHTGKSATAASKGQSRSNLSDTTCHLGTSRPAGKAPPMSRPQSNSSTSRGTEHSDLKHNNTNASLHTNRGQPSAGR